MLFGSISPYHSNPFQHSSRKNITIDSWTVGIITAIYKNKGSRSEPENYRGITLLSVLGKIFTRILNNRLDQWAEKYEIYIEAQNGFRRDRGTSDSIFILNQVHQVIIN